VLSCILWMFVEHLIIDQESLKKKEDKLSFYFSEYLNINSNHRNISH